MPEKITRIKDLPSPKGHFILGQLPQFNAIDKHKTVERWVAECGDLFQIKLAVKKFVVSANVDFNDQILRQRPNKFRRFNKIGEILEEMGVMGVFNAEGEVWKRHRKPTSEALSLKKIRGFYPVIADKTVELLSKWEQLTANNEVLDVQKELMKYTVDITTEIAFGYKLDTINNKSDAFQKYLEHIFPMINERITSALPTWRYYKQEKDKELDLALSEIEKLIYVFIEEAKVRLANNPELKENPSNFLEALLTEQEEGEVFSDEEIYGNVFSMLLAGEDTTSNSISWALFYLAQHPEVVKRVREEADMVYGSLKVPETDEKMVQLKYANAVAQESMRLKPAAPMLYMEALEDQTINDLFVPKGTVFMLQNKVPQTKEVNFSNTATFIPDRWMRGGCPMHENHKAEVVKVFGGGPRFCPGKNLAMHEMTIAISAICKRFDIELMVNPESVTEAFSFTMYPENLKIKLQKAKG